MVYDLHLKRLLFLFGLVFVSVSGAYSTPLSDHIKTVLDQNESRQQSALKKLLRDPYPPKGSKGGPGLWHYENFALGCYYNNKRCAEADQGMIKLRNKAAEGIPKDFHWNVFILRRIYSLYSAHSENPRMGPAAKRPS